MKRWKVVSEMEHVKTSPLLHVLSDRGVDPLTYLAPSLDQLHDPLLMKDMKASVERTVKAIQTGERMKVSSDYDSDGICSTYAMVTLLEEAGANVSYMIPDRKDGYGISNKLIDEAYKEGVTLIITCDNGIAAVDQVEYAKSLGIDVIITDHHEPQEVIPATLVVNPKQADCKYPFKELAGCAVAWKFCQAVLDATVGDGLQRSLKCIEIIATGTVADVMSLTGENRVIVHYGLQAYQTTNIVGLKQLLKELELTEKEITSHTIGFSIAPALNATGRLIKADEAVDMLLAKSRIKALRSAKYLGDLNRERREWTQKYTEEILADLEHNTSKVIVYARPDIPEGIIGVVAARIKEALCRPVLLMSLDESGTFYKGSGRSIDEYNLFENLTKHRDLFLKFGGHAVACGFSISAENVPILQDTLNKECTLTEEDMVPKILIDYDIHPHNLSLKFAEDLQHMQPFGKGNPKPTFQITYAKVVEYKLIGEKKNHLKLKVACDKDLFECIGFGMAEKFVEGITNLNEIWVDLAFYPGVNEWNGRRSLQLELIDFRMAQ